MNGWGALTGKSFTPMLTRMVRGALADRSIYHEVAAAEPAKNETWRIMAIVIGLGVVGGLVFTVRSFSIQLLHSILYAVVLQAAGWFARAWSVKMVGGFWLKQNLDFQRVFRPLAYSMTPAAAVGLIPGLGAIISLWCLATNMFAIRDTYRCETGQAIGLSLAGYGGALVAVTAIAPLLGSLL